MVTPDPTHPSDLSELAALLWAEDDVQDDRAAMTGSELSRASFASLARTTAPDGPWVDAEPIPGVSRLDLRMHGEAIEGHSAPVRLAARALTIVQDLVSVVGMALRGKKSLAGSISSDILDATQLNLNPAAAPGSLIFELRGSRRVSSEHQLHGVDAGLTLADLAAAEIFRVLSQAEGGPGSELRDELQRLGPRVASHLRRLNSLTLSESLLMDLRWQQGNGKIIQGQVRMDSAAEIERVIVQSRISRERGVIRGHLVTISTEDRLVIRDSSGKRIPLVESDEFTQNLAEFYDKDIVAEVDVEVEEHPVTGRDLRTYHLVKVATPSEGDDVAGVQGLLIEDVE